MEIFRQTRAYITAHELCAIYAISHTRPRIRNDTTAAETRHVMTADSATQSLFVSEGTPRVLYNTRWDACCVCVPLPGRFRRETVIMRLRISERPREWLTERASETHRERVSESDSDGVRETRAIAPPSHAPRQTR